MPACVRVSVQVTGRLSSLLTVSAFTCPRGDRRMHVSVHAQVIGSHESRLRCARVERHRRRGVRVGVRACSVAFTGSFIVARSTASPVQVKEHMTLKLMTVDEDQLLGPVRSGPVLLDRCALVLTC